ncbi:A24 family peptidase [Castellaniella sp.]|uniref:prepilin peptidase n=1 Tax=Castellaniella sp. TaxID=1955812 RepID=UPI0025C08212|nr:A24 family peptidase [Castellaniella sp.]
MSIIVTLLLALVLSRITSYLMKWHYNNAISEWQSNALEMVKDPIHLKDDEFTSSRFSSLNSLSLKSLTKRERLHQYITDAFCCGFMGVSAYLLGDSFNIVSLVILTGLILLLACHVLTDCHSHILMDDITYILLWAGLLSHIKGIPSLLPSVDMQSGVIGAFVGYMAFWLLAKVFKVLRGIDGLGMGDFKLMAVFGAWLGAEPLIWVALVGSLVGLVGMIVTKMLPASDKDIAVNLNVSSDKEKAPMEFPFGPSLCIGFLVVLLIHMSGHASWLRLL